jgi:hypothetical protein
LLLLLLPQYDTVYWSEGKVREDKGDIDKGWKRKKDGDIILRLSAYVWNCVPWKYDDVLQAWRHVLFCFAYCHLCEMMFSQMLTRWIIKGKGAPGLK